MKTPDSTFSRRGFLTGAAVAAAGAWSAIAQSKPAPAAKVPPPSYKIQRGRIRHSVMGWCFNPMPTEELIAACHRMGMTAMEGIGSQYYPKLRELGMKPSLVGSHPFKNGPANRANHPECLKKLREGIDLAVEFGAPGVITFTGMREKDLSDEQMIKNCLDCWKEVIGYAEKKGVNLCMEHLNSRDDTHPMKGHPGYFGDHVDFCVDLIKRVGSPRMKLLFDIYHVQIMDGDVIRRLKQHIGVIGHIHTAGVPGRGELDETQELNYPPIMKALLDLGYQGYVAHEFIPTWEDKLGALRHGVQVCDV
ncbi:MAG: TIM barrel protein [Verrucomicrobiota bacterium]